MAGLATVPCIVREMSDLEALEMVLVSNLEREDLNPEEEARMVRALAVAGLSSDEIVAKIHRSR
jgi:ParB family chromosome partitioning protein